MPFEGQAVPAHLNLRCANCNYLLTGLKNRICPECGEPFDPLETYQKNIKSTWEFHFTYQRPLWQYILIGVSLLPALVLYVGLGIRFGFWIYISVAWFIACALVTAVVYVMGRYFDWRGPTFWIALIYLWGVLALRVAL